MHSGGI